MLLPLLLLTASLFAQEADDGFVVPLDEDFSKAIVASPAAAAATGPMSNVAQGLYIEVTASTQSLIRDIATGKKKGYEFDNAHFLSKANWWFWGNITPNFHLNAEVAVWKFDKTMYQANSYADNVPLTTWGDGLQTLATMPFSWMQNANDNGIGAFNKIGFTIITPWIETKIGYGDLKANGMMDWKGIYRVIDRWDYVGKGFTEVSLGKDLQQHGNVTISATAALSMMRGTYGSYDLLDVKFGEDANSPKAEAALTLGTYTNSEELFRYNENNISAVSAYLKFAPIDPLKIEFHGLGTFGTKVTFNSDAMAFAGKIGWAAEKWKVSIMESYAQKNVNSVWGSDGTKYDDINANKNTVQLDVAVSPKDIFTIGLDQGATIVLNNKSEPSKNDEYKDYMSFRTQPYADINLNEVIGKDITIGLYGVVAFDKPTENTQKNTDIKSRLKEAGVELRMGDVAGMKKVTVDYAVSANAEWEMESSKIEKNNNYDLGELFHNAMFVADITDNFNVNAALIYRQYVAETKETFIKQPLGLAFGFAFNRTPLPGHPKFWMHFTYGMDPYEDHNYSLYRFDEANKKYIHRTYLLKTLDDTTKNLNVSSYIRMGLIWDLK